MKAKTITPIQPSKVTPELAFDEIADAVVKLSELGRQIQSSRLSKRAVLLLLKDMTGVSMADIEMVLDNLPNLEKRYLN